jgi:hypothetical protein
MERAAREAGVQVGGALAAAFAPSMADLVTSAGLLADVARDGEVPERSATVAAGAFTGLPVAFLGVHGGAVNQRAVVALSAFEPGEERAAAWKMVEEVCSVYGVGVQAVTGSRLRPAAAPASATHAPVRTAAGSDVWWVRGHRGDVESTFSTLQMALTSGVASYVSVDRFVMDVVGMAVWRNAVLWDVHAAGFTRHAKDVRARLVRRRARNTPLY